VELRRRKCNKREIAEGIAPWLTSAASPAKASLRHVHLGLPQNDMRDMVVSQDYRHMSIFSLALRAQPIGKIFLSRTMKCLQCPDS
jgi:hypothetical protein